jgi:hypothetical protein
MNITKGYSGEENVCLRINNPMLAWNWKNLIRFKLRVQHNRYSTICIQLSCGNEKEPTRGTRTASGSQDNNEGRI